MTEAQRSNHITRHRPASGVPSGVAILAGLGLAVIVVAAMLATWAVVGGLR